MKTSLRFVNYRFCVIALLLTAFVSFTISAQAQTFNGQPILTVTPGSLRAIITPLSHSAILLLRYEHQGYGAVHIQLRDQRGTVLYDELKAQSKYFGELDLTPLPAGLYTVELRSPTASHHELVRVKALGSSPVIATIESKQPDRILAEKELVVNQ